MIYLCVLVLNLKTYYLYNVTVSMGVNCLIIVNYNYVNTIFAS